MSRCSRTLANRTTNESTTYRRHISRKTKRKRNICFDDEGTGTFRSSTWNTNAVSGKIRRSSRGSGTVRESSLSAAAFRPGREAHRNNNDNADVLEICSHLLSSRMRQNGGCVVLCSPTRPLWFAIIPDRSSPPCLSVSGVVGPTVL
jgi:hypothetical protein